MSSNLPSPASGQTSESSPRGEQLDHLCHHLGAREPFLLVTGEAGMGKTKLVRDAVARWAARAAVAFVTNPALTRTELLEEIIRRFGVTPPTEATKPQLLACLEQRLAEVVENGQIPVIVVDDAHDLDDELLGELRLLTNATAQADLSLTIVLSGLPHLEVRLADPIHASLRQRIGAQCHVSPLTIQETRRYLHEIAGVAPGESSGPFARKACGEIFRRSGGVPLKIQALAEEAFRRARESGASSVTTEHVQAAAKALGLGAAASGTEDDSRDDAPVPAAQATTPTIASKPVAVSAPSRVETTQSVAATRPVPAPTPAPLQKPPAASESKAASTPTLAPAAKSAPMPTPAPAAKAAPTSMPSPPPPVERRVVDTRPTEERRREWVERFIGPDEPRFGSLLSVDLRTRASETDLRQTEADAPERTQATAPVPAPRRRGGPSLGRRRFPAPRLRLPRVPRAWLMPAAVGVFVATGAFVLVFVPRRSAPPQPLEVSQVLAGASSSARRTSDPAEAGTVRPPGGRAALRPRRGFLHQQLPGRGRARPARGRNRSQRLGDRRLRRRRFVSRRARRLPHVRSRQHLRRHTAVTGPRVRG